MTLWNVTDKIHLVEMSHSIKGLWNYIPSFNAPSEATPPKFMDMKMEKHGKRTRQFPRASAPALDSYTHDSAVTIAIITTTASWQSKTVSKVHYQNIATLMLRNVNGEQHLSSGLSVLQGLSTSVSTTALHPRLIITPLSQFFFFPTFSSFTVSQPSLLLHNVTRQ